MTAGNFGILDGRMVVLLDCLIVGLLDCYVDTWFYLIKNLIKALRWVCPVL